MRIGTGLSPLTSMAAALLGLSILTSPLASAKSQNIWGAAPIATTGQQQVEAPPRSIDPRIGQYFHFRNVGDVFYAGIAGGEVYYADLDEPGVMDWDDAIQSCMRKGPGWSLPSALQLQLLYKYTDEIDLYEKDIRYTQAFWYWSSSSVDDEVALRVRPYDGLSQPIKKKFSARVRCVRVY